MLRGIVIGQVILYFIEIYAKFKHQTWVYEHSTWNWRYVWAFSHELFEYESICLKNNFLEIDIFWRPFWKPRYFIRRIKYILCLFSGLLLIEMTSKSRTCLQADNVKEVRYSYAHVNWLNKFDRHYPSFFFLEIIYTMGHADSH